MILGTIIAGAIIFASPFHGLWILVTSIILVVMSAVHSDDPGGPLKGTMIQEDEPWVFLAASVDSWETHGDTTRYVVKVASTTNNYEIRKRYSDFSGLHDCLSKSHYEIAKFAFPEKTSYHFPIMEGLGYTSTMREKRDERRLRFNAFVRLLLRLKPMPPEVRDFLSGGADHTGTHTQKNEPKPGQQVTPDDSLLAYRTFEPLTTDEAPKLFSTIREKWSEVGRDEPTPGSIPVGVLELQIVEASNLPASDFGAFSDPYCIATVTGYWSHGQEWRPEMRSSFTTKSWTQTLNPAWNQSHEFPVPRSGGVLRLECFDWDATGASELLG